ncbi:hypothetical protein J6590_006534 [Homalodisca vitripennis]|nr:hypothetical protein J6590_006534 [Homalodisca vitripennis]
MGIWLNVTVSAGHLENEISYRLAMLHASSENRDTRHVVWPAKKEEHPEPRSLSTRLRYSYTKGLNRLLQS